MTGQNQIETKPVSTGNWYVTFMVMGIPVVGVIYLIVLSFSKKHPLKREFARAYLLYELSMLIASVLIILIAARVAMPYVDMLLDYMEML